MTDEVQKIREVVVRLQKRAEHFFDISLTENERQFWLGESNVLTKIEKYIDSLQEEPVSSVWHDASKEPNHMSQCLVFYGDKNDIGHYLHYEPVLYNKKVKAFVTKEYPHPTGYKIEQKSVDGGCAAEMYKDKRDRISISDITRWCYLEDLHNLSSIKRTVKNWKEPVSEDIVSVAKQYIDSHVFGNEEDKFTRSVFVDMFCSGAKWQKEQFEKNRLKHCNSITNEQAELESDFIDQHLDKHQRMPTFLDAIEYGMRLQKEKMMAKAVDVEVKVDAGGYPYIDKTIELYDYDKDAPLAKKGDRYKVILIKED